MLKLFLILTSTWLLCGLVVSNEIKTKENIYYKKTASTPAVDTKSISKEEVPFFMEGQSSPSVKLNTIKINAAKEIIKKESKTVPRKGVLNNLNETLYQNDTLLINPVLEKLYNINISSTDKILISTSTQKSSTLHVAPVRETIQEITAGAVSPKTTRKRKPKPSVTIGEKDADEPIPASPTNKSPLGIPRKIDYIVPVVITLTTLPLLGVVFYVLYKRGRDYWDKRHYRRMDFLIDGMYNE